MVEGGADDNGSDEVEEAITYFTGHQNCALYFENKMGTFGN